MNLKLPNTIIIKILNDLVSDHLVTPYYLLSFYRFVIGSYSLVCKEWRDKIVPKLMFGSVRVEIEDDDLDVIFKWFKRGIRVKSDHCANKSMFPSSESDDLTFLVKYLLVFNSDPKSNLPFSINRTMLKNNLKMVVGTLNQPLTYTYQGATLSEFLNKLKPFNQRIQSNRLKSLSYITEGCSNHQDLDQCIKDYGIVSLILNGSPIHFPSFSKLTCLTYSVPMKQKVSNSFIDTLAKTCINLEKLTLAGTFTEATIFVDSLVKHKTLTHLSVYPNQSIGQVRRDFDQIVNYLNKNKVIKVLNSKGFITLDSYKHQNKVHNTTLHTISCADSPKFETFHNYFHYLRMWNSRSSLRRFECRHIDEIILNAVQKYHENVRQLKLFELKRGHMLVELLQSIPLEAIEIEECIMGDLLNRAIEMNFPSLKSLEVATDGDDGLLTALALNTHLRELELYIVPSKTFQETTFLRKLLFQNAALKKLSFYYTYITDDIKDLLKEYYSTHPSPILPENLIINNLPSFDIFIKVKNI